MEVWEEFFGRMVIVFIFLVYSIGLFLKIVESIVRFLV